MAIIAEKNPRADYNVKCSCIKKGLHLNMNYEGRSINNITYQIYTKYRVQLTFEFFFTDDLVNIIFMTFFTNHVLSSNTSRHCNEYMTGKSSFSKAAIRGYMKPFVRRGKDSKEIFKEV